MKRFFTFFLAVCLLSFSAVTAFAEGEFPSTLPADPFSVWDSPLDYDPETRVAKIRWPDGYIENEMPMDVLDFLTTASARPKNVLSFYMSPYTGHAYTTLSFVMIPDSTVFSWKSSDLRAYFSDPNSGASRSVDICEMVFDSSGFISSCKVRKSNYIGISLAYSRLLYSDAFSSNDTLNYSVIPEKHIDRSHSISHFSLIPNDRQLSISYIYEDGSEAAPSFSSRFDLNAPYAITSPAVVGHTPNQLVVSGDMPDTDLHFTVTYSPTPYELSVDFLNDSGGEVAPPVTKTVLYNEPYSVDCPAVPGYIPESETVSGIMPASDLGLSVAYETQIYNLTIEYLKQDGTKAFDPVVKVVPYGGSYSVTSPVLDGWQANKPLVSGTMPSNDLKITVTYSPPRPPLMAALEDSFGGFLKGIFANVFPLLVVGIFILTVLLSVRVAIQIVDRFTRF